MKKLLGIILAAAVVSGLAITDADAEGPGRGPGREPGPGGPGVPGGPEMPGMCHPGMEDAGRPMQWKGTMGDGEMQEAMIVKALENPELVKKIGLSEETVATLKNKLFEIKKKEIKLRYEKELAGLEQAKLLTDKVPDEKKLMNAVETTGKIQIEIAKLGIQKVLLIQTSLSDEQRAKIRTIIRERMKDRMERAGKLSGGGSERPMMGGKHDPEKIREHMRKMKEKREEFKGSKPAPLAPEQEDDDDGEDDDD